MTYKDTPYFNTARAGDLSGSDRRLYRSFEVLPGFLAWTTLFFTFFLSYYSPMYSAFFIIAFNVYWVLKSFYLSIHLRGNWKRLRYHMRLDWEEMLRNFKWKHVFHLVVLPVYKESFEIIETNILSLLRSRGDKQKMAVVLTIEERAGSETEKTAREIEKKYASKFGYFLVTIHPKDIPGEMPGKGSNIAFAAEEARVKILDREAIPYENVIVSALDIDTIVYPDYFLCLTWHFLTTPNPYSFSYQPVPLYNNNIWDSPALSRVVATSGTFWQMIQQERPERLTTFSSHSMTFKALYETGYWQKNIVSEDSRIFWNAFFAHDGNYGVVPLSYPVSMDANLAPTFWETLKNIYKQQRRWSWGVENLPYIFMGFVKNPKISLRRKIKIAVVEIERAWSLATNPILLFLFNWLPILVGGRKFNATVLSYNLPIISRYLTLLGVLGIVLSAIISLSFLPPVPAGRSNWKKALMFLQWVFIPVTLVVFGSIPAFEAQTRLMLGKYMGFWVTPKHREK